MDKKLRVGVVGAGFIGQQQMDAIRRVPCAALVAAADSDMEGLTQNNAWQRVDSLYSDYREMIDGASLDAVHICSPNNLHYEMCRYALERGLHVFCDKPLTVNSRQSQELAELAAERGCANGVNFVYRSNAAIHEMRSRVLSGAAGRTLLVHGHYLQDWLMYEDDYSWRMDEAVNGPSRAVADIGSHWFDAAQFATGKNITAVYAMLETCFPVRKKPLHKINTFENSKNAQSTSIPITSEDAAAIIVRFEDNTLGSLLISQVSGGHKNDFALSVDCERYSMRWRQEEAERLWISSRQEGSSLLFASGGMMTDEAERRFALLPEGHDGAWRDAIFNGIREFYQSIIEERHRSCTQSYATFEDGLAIVRLVEACMESNRKNEWISL